MRRRTLSALEAKIDNGGERLIPGVTQDMAELVRHRNSYLFFKQVIENDIATQKVIGPVSIVDLGCGVGHGCATLSKIDNTRIVGVDSSAESVEYAKAHYARDNVVYQVADLLEHIPSMQEFDYVVSRNVFEHLPGGLDLAMSAKWRHRLLFDVPYDEPAGRNPHHVVHRIREESFAQYPRVDLLFQDLDGIVYDHGRKPAESNVIICVRSRPGLETAVSGIGFPFLAFKPRFYMPLRRIRRHRATQWLRWLFRERLGF
jgi:SAM-dependent methyltransferase